MSDNGAVLAGYTKELYLTSMEADLFVLVKPDADLDGIFKAWDTDNQQWIIVNGWTFTAEEVA